MSDPTSIPLLNSIVVNECKGRMLVDTGESTNTDEALATVRSCATTMWRS